MKAGMTSFVCTARQCRGAHDARRSKENLMLNSPEQGQGIRPLQYKWGTHIARGSKQNLVSNLKGAAGQDDQPREEVF